MSTVLLDTNVVIAIINGIETSINPLDIPSAAISAITVMELFALAGMSDSETANVELFVNKCLVLPVDAKVARRAGVLSKIRRQGKPDLLIAATAIENRLPLLTRNTKDFRKIPGLVLMPA
ncbi:MAG: type II toxin-antitoxin system VapC family toxin [Patescibacteria group bacterium]